MAGTAVMLMGFGGPDSLESVGPFMANLMGREPSPEALERVKRRYLTIGGASPLPAIAAAMADKLREELGKHDKDMPVVVGMRYWRPFIRDAIERLVEQGIDRIIAVSLSPFESSASSGAYRAALATAAAEFPSVTIVEAPSFRDRHGFIDSLVEACKAALADLPGEGKRAVIFSAHSLPASELNGDPYVDQLRETAATVAVRAGLIPPDPVGAQTWLEGIDAYGSGISDVPWVLAYQSKGMRPADWLGPEVVDVVDAMAKAGYAGVVFCPIGFATDHMETLYDLDVEAAGRAYDLEMEFWRADVPNDSDPMIEALLESVLPLV